MSGFQSPTPPTLDDGRYVIMSYNVIKGEEWNTLAKLDK